MGYDDDDDDDGDDPVPGRDADGDSLMSTISAGCCYTVCGGAVDRLALVCSGVRDPLGVQGEAVPFLLAALELLSALTARCGGVGRADPSGLGATLRSTELVGAVSMLYGLLLQQGQGGASAPRAPGTPPPTLDAPTACIARATIALLVRVAELDLAMFQSILGAEGISLQLRHITAHLLWVCAGQEQVLDQLRDLLHLVIRVLGYFVVRNHDNQLVLQSGVQPTVLQQLCQLPFPYFSEPRLSAVLFPTLLACCSDNAENRAILEQELSYDLLEGYRLSAAADGDPLILLLRDPKDRPRGLSRASSVCSNGEASAAASSGPEAKKARTTLEPSPENVKEAKVSEGAGATAAAGDTVKECPQKGAVVSAAGRGKAPKGEARQGQGPGPAPEAAATAKEPPSKRQKKVVANPASASGPERADADAPRETPSGSSALEASGRQRIRVSKEKL
ncbi:S phase cyclin A-associated protein in the endoplasmic reticulum [Frankliniella fusca]|uniref:S phase cyclin A-associated protein in the endoplasmic reticulum n=1 Tax=Frankliniella fusca TaxID=407009 RepID=A0AAE1HP84_9NEOP|nr:S phase cyclin A-associated protein in the endoplasmic reticulum [Frankliniella fusca]